MSQPPNVRSFNSASGTNFLTSGDRPSVRLPRRMVPNCVSEPTGCDLPLRTNSTPAIKVVLTAPMPGISIPSFPFGGAIFPGFSINSSRTEICKHQCRQQMVIHCTNKPVMMSEERRICKSDRQIREKDNGPMRFERKPAQHQSQWDKRRSNKTQAD